MLKVINSLLLAVIAILIAILAYRTLFTPHKLSSITKIEKIGNIKEIDENKIQNDPDEKNTTSSNDNPQDNTDQVSQLLSNPKLKDYVEQAVKEYLEKEPQVIINALESLQKRKIEENEQKTSSFLSNNPQIFTDDNNVPVIGNKTGSKVILALYDYNCGYCRKGNAVLEELAVGDKDVKVILKPLPILGPMSTYAAKTILAVNIISPEKALLVHDLLIKMQPISEDNIKNLLRNNQIDYALFEKTLANQEIQNTLDNMFKLASDLQVQGAPVYIMGHKVLHGFVDFQTMKNILETEYTDNK